MRRSNRETRCVAEPAGPEPDSAEKAHTRGCDLSPEDLQKSVRGPVRISRFRLADMRDVLALEEVCFPGEAFDKALFERFAAKWPESFLVARRGGRLIGYSLAEIDGEEAELVSIAVAPGERRRGVGETLLRATLRRLRRAGCALCRLSVRTSNTGALRLYEKLGFRPVRRIPNYYADGAEALRMKKALGLAVRR